MFNPIDTNSLRINPRAKPSWEQQEALRSSSVPTGELGLEELDDLGVHPERLYEHRRRDRRRGPEQRQRNEDDAWVLAVERHHHGGLLLADVELEVHEAARDDEGLPGADDLGVVPVAGVEGADDADEELAAGHDPDLGGARVDVRRVGAAGGEVDAVHGDAQRVQAGPLVHVELRHVGAVRVGPRVAAAGDPAREEELVAGRRGRLARVAVHGGLAVEVGDAEVLERVRVGGRQERSQKQKEQRGGGQCC